MQKFQESFDEQKSSFRILLVYIKENSFFIFIGLSEQQVNELKNQIKSYQEQM